MEDSRSKDFLSQFFLNCGFATRALHAGEHVGQPQHRSHAGAIYQTSTFVFENAAEGAEMFSGAKQGYVYTRLGNPTVLALEGKLNALEGGEVKLRDPSVRVSSLAFSSGMAAVSSTLMALCSQGDELIMGKVLYGASQHLAVNVLARFGVKVIEVDTSNLTAVEACLHEHPKAKAFLFESPTNPTLTLADIAAIVGLKRNLAPAMKIIVDNTFATPYLQRPLELGADVVIHSTTKYLCGHGTVVGGIMTTVSDEVKDKAYTIIKDVGGSPSPFDAWLVNLGIKTLPVRMEKHCANARALARFLADHPKVERVHFPGLETHPQYGLAKRQMRDFGGMVSFDIKGGIEAGRRLMDNIKIFTLAVSLGCVDSLIEHPASMTHACVPRDKREPVGITDGLVRVSAGIEDEADLIRALDEGLAKV
ncbi:MAG TPA: PLP-dependent aspartate aminotransferase family protein [Polyangia bacterium]